RPRRSGARESRDRRAPRRLAHRSPPYAEPVRRPDARAALFRHEGAAMTDALLIYGAGAHARKVCHAWTLAGGGGGEAFADDAPAAVSPVPGFALRPANSLDTMPANTALFVAIGRAQVRRRL